MNGTPHDLLTDVRVLDVSRILAGPFCGQLLGDLGAEIIKIERPHQGDDTRTWGPPFVGLFSAYFLSCNRNKRAVAVDLANEKGREIFHALARKSDIVLENFLAKSAVKLGADAETLLQINPRLIICSISGYGRTGPLQDIPGYDNAIQARSGLMNITGPVEGPPFKVGVALTDVLTGLYAAVAVLACLNARRRSGHGYHIDLALLDCALASQVNVAQAYLATGIVPPRQGNAHLQIVPYQAFQAAYRWLEITVGNDAQWQRFCDAINRADLAQDERFHTNRTRVENREVLLPQLEKALREKTSAQWQQLLTTNNVPHAPVWDYAELFDQDHIRERGMRLTVRTPDGAPVDLVGSPFHVNGSPMSTATAPPKVGEHTIEILQDVLGMDESEIAALKSKDVIE